MVDSQEAPPRCPDHDIPLTWQTGWGYPSWAFKRGRGPS